MSAYVVEVVQAIAFQTVQTIAHSQTVRTALDVRFQH